jgi:APA family basic amino acid/polyamine antiporter
VLVGTFDQLLLYTGFAVTLFAGTAVAALFVLRKKIQETSHPFRAWGYPVAPAVFVAVSAVMVVNYVWRQPLESGVGIVCIVAGIPLYWMFKKTSRDKVIEQ